MLLTVIASEAKQSPFLCISLIAIAIITSGIFPFAAHAMLPEEMTGGRMETEEPTATTTVSDAPQLVCVQRTDPVTGAVQYVTATLDAASQLSGTSIAPGPCQSEKKRAGGDDVTHYGIGYLPEPILRAGVPQSFLQTVIQVIFSAFYIVLDIGDR